MPMRTAAVPALVAVLLAAASPARAQVSSRAAAPAFDGTRRELDVSAPRVEAAIDVDGRLDEPVWRGAAVLSGFSEYAPVDGPPAEDSTEVLVWYSPQAIHIGIRAFEPHAPVNAKLADRDRIDADDQVQLLLDTYDDRRRALLFAVNPLGVQADGVRTEATVERRGFSAAPDPAVVDLSPDFLFQSRGRLTDYGYEVEVRIPFRSIRYQSARSQDWGLHVLRVVQHSGHVQSWAPARRDASSFLAQAGKLRGLHDLHPGMVVDLNPVLTARMDGAPAAGGWRYGGPSPEPGANARWVLTSNLTLNATANPDFSQVETDAGQVSFDPRRALFFPEKRPFFLEGSEQFDTPNRLVYTRRIVAPIAAAKLTGKVAGTDVGVLSALDDPPAAGDARPLLNVLRVRRDVGAGSTLGMVYTDRAQGAHFNRVVGGDARLVFGRIYTVAFQGAGSFTRSDGRPGRAPLWNASFDRAGRRFSLQGGVDAIDPDFVAAAGFLSRVGTVQLRLNPRLTVNGRPGAVIESWSGALNLYATWLYDRFFEGGASEDAHIFINNSFALRGGWRLDGSLILESFGYPEYLYADYAVERRGPAGLDTVPYVGTPRIGNLDVVLTAATPQWTRGGGNIQVIVGRDENFDEWAPGYILVVNGTARWRPTEQLRLDASYIRQQYVRPSDLSSVSVRDVPRLKLEYQVTRDLFLRFVGQYDARRRDALRDDTRTNDPVLIRDPASGEYRPALRQVDNALRVDWLFSYRPVPGTVVYLGYGSSLTEPEALRFRPLSRTSDAFFMKLSYLFRL